MLFGRKPSDITQIRATSKLSLKMSCLAACGNDVDKADRLYKYISDGLDSLPDVDPLRPSVFDQIKGGANDIFGWIGEHKGDLIEGWNMIKALRGGSTIPVPSGPPADIPPIPTE